MSSTYDAGYNVPYSSTQAYYIGPTYTSHTHHSWGTPTSTMYSPTGRVSSILKPVLRFEFLYRKLGVRKTITHNVWATNEEEAMRDAPSELPGGFVIVGFLGRARRNNG